MFNQGSRHLTYRLQIIETPAQVQRASHVECLCVRTLYGLWVQVFVVLNLLCNHKNTVFLTTGCCARPCMTCGYRSSWYSISSATQKNSVFNNWMFCKMPLCQDPVWLVDTDLCGTPVSCTTTKKCVFNNWMSCKTLHDLVLMVLHGSSATTKKFMFLTTRCRAECLCVRTLLQPVDTGLCVTSTPCQDPVTACRYRSLCYLHSVSGPCYSL